MLIEEREIKDTRNKERCANCGSTLECNDYIYRRKSTYSGYICSKCGFFEFYNNE